VVRRDGVDAGGIDRRTVVEDLHEQLVARPVEPADRIEQRSDRRGFAVSRDLDRDERQLGQACRRLRRSARHERQEREADVAQHEQSADDAGHDPDDVRHSLNSSASARHVGVKPQCQNSGGRPA